MPIFYSLFCSSNGNGNPGWRNLVTPSMATPTTPPAAYPRPTPRQSLSPRRRRRRGSPTPPASLQTMPYALQRSTCRAVQSILIQSVGVWSPTTQSTPLPTIRPTTCRDKVDMIGLHSSKWFITTPVWSPIIQSTPRPTTICLSIYRDKVDMMDSTVVNCSLLLQCGVL